MLKLISKFLQKKYPTWRQVERFDPAWKSRIERMASFITPNDQSIVDVGCGPMWLRDFLSADTKYTGIDYMYRGENMIVCDLNSQPTPEVSADVWFISGCLEYLDNPHQFISDASRLSKKCILSYCDIEHFPSMSERMQRGWRNHLSVENIKESFTANGMRVMHTELSPSSNAILVFSK